MNREIKFRAWDNDEREMLYGLDKILNEFDGFRGRLDKLFNGCPPIMQYTGLKDKSGKEIYEGDIIEFDKFEWYRSPVLSRADIEKKPPYREEVKWDFSLLNMRGNDYKSYCEVIGNIYDSPELLK